MDLKISEVMNSKKISIELLKQRIEDNGGSLSRTSISNIINNKSVPRVDTLNMIAGALDVPITKLYGINSETIHLIIKEQLHTFESVDELKEYVSGV